MRTRGIRVILTATLAVAAVLTSPAEASAAEPVKSTIFHMAWNKQSEANTPECSSARLADVWEPPAAGKYPVAIVTGGTSGSITAPAYQELAKEFGRQGFVAIIPDYNAPEFLFPDVSRVRPKADCTYSPSRPESVMTKVCAREKADCTKGIVTSGHSQGGAMALLGYNYDSRIRAAHVWGTGKGVPFSDKLKDKIRVIAGQNDNFMKTPEDLKDMTGVNNCDDQWECFVGSNGNGWRRVRNIEVQDLDADHCFTINGSCLARALDKNTMNASVNWSYPATVTWLKKFVTP